MTEAEVRAIFAAAGQTPELHFDGTYEAGRAARIAASGMTAADLQATLAGNTTTRSGTPYTAEQVIEWFEAYGLDPYTNFDGTEELGRAERIAQEISSGTRTFSDFMNSLNWLASNTPLSPTDKEQADTIDYLARTKALYPWLPDNLITMFAKEWADSGDATLALATVRISAEYDAAFPGIKRDDGSLRMTESEWFSTREAYATLFREFGLNDALFADRYTELMEGLVSPMELAGRLGAAYEMISNNIPEVADAYSNIYGVNGSAALFASFIDPDLGQAILDRRISVAQVAGEGLARGFDVDATLAGKLVSGGVDQNLARNFFVQAEGQLQTLDDLARRHRDPDDTFDLGEFADANVFGDATQTKRIRRLLHAEASLYTDQTGSVTTGREGAVTGLSAR